MGRREGFGCQGVGRSVGLGLVGWWDVTARNFVLGLQSGYFGSFF